MQYVLIIHEVEDYALWKQVFDAAADMRRDAGERTYQVFKYESNPNKIVHFSAWTSIEDAKRFFESPQLVQIRAAAGVKSPDFIYLNQLEAGTLSRPLILHITPRSRWQAAQVSGLYRADSLDTEGFIHCSRSHQLLWVANKFYQGQSDLVLLCIDPSQLQAELRDETIDTGAQFPHIYGALNVDAVAHVLEFAPDASGAFQIPSWPSHP